MTRQDDLAVREPAPRTLPGFTDQLIQPLSRLRSEVDRLFEDFPARWPSVQFGRLTSAMPVPAIEMTETDKGYKLSVEVPGMDAGDIEVSIDDRTLVIAGEKKEEREEKEKGYVYSERTYGSFERRIALPAAADTESIKAKVRKGVLQISLRKDESASRAARKVAVEADRSA